MDINLIINIVIGVIVLAAIGVLWYKDKKKEALHIIAFLVDSAEKKFGSGTGPMKYTQVTTELYPKLPRIFRSWFTAKTVDKWIEDEVNKLQAKIDKAIKESK
jgi:hypothetical protein